MDHVSSLRAHARNGSTTGRGRLVVAATLTILVSLLCTTGTPIADAAPTIDGVEWRELYETTGLSRDQVASVCPTDGATACSGAVGSVDLTGWVWATGDQVRGLLDDYAPSLSSTSPLVSGSEGFTAAVGFLGVMRWTTYTALTYFYSESNEGWTASRDANGAAVVGGALYSTSLTGSTSAGSIGLWSSSSSTADPVRGVWLWRRTSPPPPTCLGRTATLVGTPGKDSLTGTSGVDIIAGLGGHDSIDGLGGDDVICGDDGNDTIRAGSGNDRVDGGAGDDDLYGDAGNDYLDGGPGRDSIRGGTGTDRCVSGEIRMASC